MRILFASHYALPHLGGIEVVIDAVARELAARGHDVCHLASASRRPDETGGAEPTAYRVLRVAALNGLESRAGVPWPLFSPSLVPVIRREVARADVVHGHGALYLSAVGALAEARRRHLPARVLTEHVGHVAYERRLLDLVQRAAFATLGRTAISSARALVVLNDKVESELRAVAGGRPVVHIPNGVDAARYRPAAAGEREALRAALGWDDRPRVLFVGRLVAKKGLDAALAAAAHAAGAFELCVVGPGRAPRTLPAHVEVMGPQPPEQVARLYRAADAFLLPSRGEGFPVTAQEAMASGLPAVLATDPGYAAYVAGAGQGVRQAQAAGPALAAALHDLLGDETGRRAAGAAAADHARRAFSWSRAADEHLALYARLAP